MTTKIKPIERELIRESIFIIGHVLSVDGRIVKIKLNKNKNHSHILFEGKTVKNVSVGGYVKIVKGFVSIIGKVEGEFISEEKYFNKEYNKEETKINRILQVSLFGHFEGNCFKQGIKEMPLIDNECFLLNREEFNALHQFYKNSRKINSYRKSNGRTVTNNTPRRKQFVCQSYWNIWQYRKRKIKHACKNLHRII